MDWSEFWPNFFSALGGTATALIIAGVGLELLVKFRLKRHIEKFKTDLQLELMKGSLLHTKRVEKAAKIYARCVFMVKIMEDWNESKMFLKFAEGDRVAELQQRIDDYKTEATTRSHALTKLVLANTLYFDDAIDKALTAFRDAIHGAFEYLQHLGIEADEIKTQRVVAIEALKVVEAVFKALLKN